MTDLKKRVSRRTIVTIRCIGCGFFGEIEPRDIAPGEHPMCRKCGMPMIAVKARVLAERNAKRKGKS